MKKKKKRKEEESQKALMKELKGEEDKEKGS
jgi:hypothetical protein